MKAINNLILRVFVFIQVYRSRIIKILIFLLVADIAALVLFAYFTPDTVIQALEILVGE